MKQFALAIIGSLLTGIYWWILFTIVYANVLFAGDRNPARQPAPDRDILIGSGTAIIVGVLLYAVLAMLWRRLMARWLPADR